MATRKEPWEMTEDEARKELDALELKFAGPHGPANRSLTSTAALTELRIDAPRADALRERLGKHYWQRTKAGVWAAEKMPEAAHRKQVEKALAEGKPIPQEVINDYPDLAGKREPAMPSCQTCPYWLRLNDAFLLEHFGQRGICEEYQRIAAHIDPYSLLWTLPGENCERHPGRKAEA